MKKSDSAGTSEAGMVFGGGHHCFSWINVQDVARIYPNAMDDSRPEGAIDVVAPEMITQREVVHSINQRLGKNGHCIDS